MMESRAEQLTLAIETANGGGSLAILKDRQPIAVWSGEGQVSKAEDLLEQIADLLNGNPFGREHIKSICVSKGIGSLTGEKIGRSIARGLSRAFGCRLIELSIFDALRSALRADFAGQLTTAVQSGKDRIIWQRQEKKGEVFVEISNTTTSSVEQFHKVLKASEKEKFLIFGNSSEDWSRITAIKKKRITIFNRNLAALLGSHQSDEELVASDNDSY